MSHECFVRIGMWPSQRFIYWIMKTFKNKNVFLLIFFIYLQGYYFQSNKSDSEDRSKISLQKLIGQNSNYIFGKN